MAGRRVPELGEREEAGGARARAPAPAGTRARGGRGEDRCGCLGLDACLDA